MGITGLALRKERYITKQKIYRSLRRLRWMTITSINVMHQTRRVIRMGLAATFVRASNPHLAPPVGVPDPTGLVASQLHALGLYTPPCQASSRQESQLRS
jgi:hypothetical protein